MGANPYDFTDPVRDPRMFFGRGELLKEIVESFCGPNPHSHSIFGGRRFGKTSLLRAIERWLTERMAARDIPCAVPLYIDLNYEIIGSRGAFFACVVQRLREMLRQHLSQVDLDSAYLDQLQGQIAAERDPLPFFERAFVYVRNTAFPVVGTLQVVLLIDESERILSQPWAPELHSNLRALLSNRPATQDSLGIKMAGSSDFYARITEEGSPLRNILLKRLLLPLSEEEARALIDGPTGGVLPQTVVDEILRQAGGHPFLLQYLMYYLWEAGLSEATVETVGEIVGAFTDERDDFEDWCEGIGPVGERIYAMLCQRCDWTRRADIFRAVEGTSTSVRDRTDIKKALEALSYHGLVFQDREAGFRTGAEMFRAWFEEFKAPAYRLPTPAEEKADEQTMSYQDFELLVTAGRTIRASSDQGEEEGELALDVNEAGSTLRLVEAGNTDAKLLKELGATFYRALFPADVHALFRATAARAEADGRGVRVRLIIEPPDLSSLPWEFLYDADTNTFLANSVQTALSRYISIPLARREIKAVSPPLKVLIVIAGPRDLPAMDAGSEEDLVRQALARSLQSGQIEIDLLAEATMRAINQKLREKPFNVFHFVGHGAWEEERGFVALLERDGRARWVDDETFSNFFLGNRSLGLIFLNACRTAASSTQRAFVGMAPTLVRRGIPAVIAMQYAVADETARLFSDEFYRTLALGWSVDAAIQTTRNAISMEVGLDRLDFAAPVLFMRAKDGIILGSG